MPGIALHNWSRLACFSSALGLGALACGGGHQPPPTAVNIVQTPIAPKPPAPQPTVPARRDIFLLPKQEQLPLWYQLAATSDEPMLQREALIQLGWLGDVKGVELATKALSAGHPRVRAAAAQVLAYYGSPKADSAKSALYEALRAADESDKPAFVWALVTLKEAAVFNVALELHRARRLWKVERLSGGSAFDAERLAGLVPITDLAKLAEDKSPSVRQLVAMALSRSAESRWTPTLLKLLNDPDDEVGSAAASGLVKAGDEATRASLVDALRAADKDRRQRLLEALRDGAGGEGLVRALDAVKTDTEELQWFQTRQIFDMLRELADPRAADALVNWVNEKKPSLHWQGEAGTRLAEIGDVRGARFLGLRMAAEPGKLYSPSRFWEADAGGHLTRTDLPRVVGARMLADLAVMHPEAKAQLKADAEDAVIRWLKGKPQPHMNGVRFLAAVGSQKALNDLRRWAFPKAELPKDGAVPPFPAEFEIAQGTLRYIGWMKDEPSFTKLTDQFKRKKDRKMNITQEGLDGAGLAMLGMALRAVAYGAAQGLAQWGDARAVKPLMEFIEDETWHEEARLAACEALAWCADDKTMAEVAKKAKESDRKKEPTKQMIGACYAATLAQKPVPSAVPSLVELLTPNTNLYLRMQIARAIGVSGFDETVERVLFDKLKNDTEVRTGAALALILGGSSETAARTVAMYADFSKDALDDLKDHYFRAFGYWSDEDLKRGNIYRWVRNAIAIAHVTIGDVAQDWARQRLEAQFENLQYDNGPHSETRVVLRYRLFEAARTGDVAARSGAIQTLRFMKEKGVLMALRQERGEVGELAAAALHDLMNPPVVAPEIRSRVP